MLNIFLMLMHFCSDDLHAFFLIFFLFVLRRHNALSQKWDDKMSPFVFLNLEAISKGDGFPRRLKWNHPPPLFTPIAFSPFVGYGMRDRK